MFWCVFRGRYASWVHLIKTYLPLLILLLVILALIALVKYAHSN